jgi:hypothetical protein
MEAVMFTVPAMRIDGRGWGVRECPPETRCMRRPLRQTGVEASRNGRSRQPATRAGEGGAELGLDAVLDAVGQPRRDVRTSSTGARAG